MGIQLPSVTVTIDGGERSWSPKVEGGLRWTGALDMGDATAHFDITKQEWQANRGQLMYPNILRIDDGPENIWVGHLNDVGIGDEFITINAAGPGTDLNYRFRPIFLQVMDLKVWGQAGQLPYLDPDSVFLNKDFTCAVTPDGYLRWVNHTGDSGGKQGFVAAFPGIPIKRFAFFNGAPGPSPGTAIYWHIYRGTTYAPARQYWYAEPPYNVDIRPALGADYEQSYSTTTVADSTHPAWAVTAARHKPYDFIVLLVGGPSPESPGGIANAKNVRINSDIVTVDEYSPQQVAAYIAGQMGWTTLPSPTGINILPYYSHEGQPWSAILDYVSRAAGGTWRVHGLSQTDPPKPQLQIQPWATTPEDDSVWVCSRGDPGTVIELAPFGRRINAVRLGWTDVAGFGRETYKSLKLKENDDLGYDQEKDYQLSEPFPVDSVYPDSFATVLLDTHAKAQFSGHIKGAIARHYEQSHDIPMRRIQPGDTVYVPEDKDNGLGGLYPVHSTSHDDERGETTLGIGSIAPQVDQELFNLDQLRLRDPKQFV